MFKPKAVGGGGGAAAASTAPPPPAVTFDHKRDAYGFAVRPQHAQRYKEYVKIYQEEEEERSDKWKDFLERQLAESSEILTDNESTKLHEEEDKKVIDEKLSEPKAHNEETWMEIRSSLGVIEEAMSVRITKKINTKLTKNLSTIEEFRNAKGGYEEDSEEEFYDLDKTESDATSTDISASTESLPPWKEELEILVQGGVPMALRGELWQAFVGVRARREKKYYHGLLALDSKNKESEKWKVQIEKDLPRTFPGHPALDEDGRNSLRRLLTAYALHNPSVGYCQGMNFFAGLLLLLMPEESAFWTLVGILDDYFDGYYSEEMIESQVDQLVLEELVREKFPKLVHHLDYLGVQVAWVAGPWFLSIFMNMLPWESVLRVWDVILYEGNRVMLFRTALALMELYGPALVTTKDAGDAVTLLQSLAGSTFDSSQLVLTACMGYLNVNENRLQELRIKHRPSVRASVDERLKGLIPVSKDAKGLASKLYSFKHNNVESVKKLDIQSSVGDDLSNNSNSPSSVNDLYMSLTGNKDIDSLPDLQDQVVWLKVELCKLLEEKRCAELRAEELETALMEMVKQDNRRQLSARAEQLQQEVGEIRQVLSDKQEQENVMLQVLMRVEQEQKVTEDARRYAEQDAAAQRYAAQVLQEKYEVALASLDEMEKRAVMAESMLEATMQYQSGQTKTQPSPRSSNQDDSPIKKISLLSRPFGLGWRDKNKGKPADNSTQGGSTEASTQQEKTHNLKDADS